MCSVPRYFRDTSAPPSLFTPRGYGGKTAGHGLAVYSDAGWRTIQDHGKLPKEVSIEVPPSSAMLVEQTPL
jgi:hypothetical protein